MSKQLCNKNERDMTQSRNETDGLVFILLEVIYSQCKGFWGGGSTA